MIKKIYIAGPLFNRHERWYLEEIAHELENAEYDCFLPHRDQAGINESQIKTAKITPSIKGKIFENDLNALRNSDMTVALITGWDIDSGTAGEIGYTFASGKPVIAIDADERRFRNLFVEGMITETVRDVAHIIPAIERIKT